MSYVGRFHSRDKFVYLDKFSVITTILQERMVFRDLMNFGQSRQILKLAHRRPKFSQVKTWQDQVNKQNRDKLVNHLSCKLRQESDWTEINLLDRQKLSFAAKFGDSKILKGLRINPGSWRWNPLATMLAGLINRSGTNGIWRFWIFNPDATDETKICHDYICSLIFSRQF